MVARRVVFPLFFGQPLQELRFSLGHLVRMVKDQWGEIGIGLVVLRTVSGGYRNELLDNVAVVIVKLICDCCHISSNFLTVAVSIVRSFCCYC